MEGIVAQIHALINEHVLIWPSLAQLLSALGLLVVATIFWRHGRPRIEKEVARILPPGRKDKQSVEDFSDLLWLAMASLIFLVVEQTARHMGISHHFMKILASLAVAWVVIRFASFFIRERFWAVSFALAVWGLAALHILGLTPIAADILQGIGFSIGGSRISLYLVLKALVVFSIIMKSASLTFRYLDAGLSQSDSLSPSQQVLVSKALKFGLFAAAVIVAVESAGINLTSLKILSGAIGVGVGFGLQKIAANLISGLILLLDKSIKPGDTIQIGNLYGWITSLSARYVSVATRDGKEHLIPNEKLITDEVINWSFTNPRIRLHIPVGVGYGTDLPLAMKLMEESARAVARVLPNPAPACRLIGFGDSSVNLEVRVWIQDPKKGITSVTSEVLMGVWDAFHLHGIELPFAQRDVTIRKLPEEATAFLKRV